MTTALPGGAPRHVDGVNRLLEGKRDRSCALCLCKRHRIDWGVYALRAAGAWARAGGVLTRGARIAGLKCICSALHVDIRGVRVEMVRAKPAQLQGLSRIRAVDIENREEKGWQRHGRAARTILEGEAHCDLSSTTYVDLAEQAMAPAVLV